MDDECRGEDARRLADEYVSLLRSYGIHLLLLTEAEFAALPARVINAVGMSRIDRTRALTAVRNARKQLLDGSDAALRSCYDYCDQMMDEEEHALFYAYKLIETLQNKFGGEKAQIQALDLREQIKYAKRAANDRKMDERHAPTDAEKPEAPPFDRATALQYTRDILRAYELYLRR